MANCLTHLVAVILGFSRFRCATIASPQSLWSNLTFLPSGARVGFWLTCAMSSTQTNVRYGFAPGSQPAICESCEPACALEPKLARWLLRCYHQTFEEQAVARSEKKLPSFIWKVVSIRETPLCWYQMQHQRHIRNDDYWRCDISNFSFFVIRWV